jgi:hypothetical protein
MVEMLLIIWKISGNGYDIVDKKHSHPTKLL